MDIYLIRHAKPDYVTDSLTDEGRDEAQRLADYLRPVKFDAIYVSPLGRARDTARLIARSHRMKTIKLPWLAELHGEFEPNIAAWNITARQIEADPNMITAIDLFMADQEREARAGFDALLAEYGYERNGLAYRATGRPTAGTVIAIVAHGGLNTTLLSSIFSWPLPMMYAYFDYRTTGITHLRMIRSGQSAALKATAINARPHLPIDDALSLPTGRAEAEPA